MMEVDTPHDEVLWPTKESICKTNIESKPHIACKYNIIRTELGTGTYATVKEAIHIESQYHYAVKIIKKNFMNGREQLIQNEISVLKYISKFNHKNLLMLNDFFETDDELYLVTDLCTGGDLFEKITQSGSYFEKDAIHIIKCITSAVLFLHKNSIIHRDLKSENLIFKTRSLKSDILIADFGLAKVCSNEKEEKLTLLCGTLSYVAPEVLVQKFPLPGTVNEQQRGVYDICKQKGYSYPVDVWSIGVLTYFILCGYMPFDCETDDETREAIMIADFYYEPEEYWSDISAAAKDFINKCFNIDPAKRISLKDLNQHLFLTSGSTSKVNLLPKVRSNYSLHKLGLSPRHSPINTPKQLSPQHSYTNVQDFLQRTASTNSLISMNRLNQQLMSLSQAQAQGQGQGQGQGGHGGAQQQRAQQMLAPPSTNMFSIGGTTTTTTKPKGNNSNMMESITSTQMRPSQSQLSTHKKDTAKTYLEESRTHLQNDPSQRMEGCLSNEPEIILMDILNIKSQQGSRANSTLVTPADEKPFFI